MKRKPPSPPGGKTGRAHERGSSQKQDWDAKEDQRNRKIRSAKAVTFHFGFENAAARNLSGRKYRTKKTKKHTQTHTQPQRKQPNSSRRTKWECFKRFDGEEQAPSSNRAPNNNKWTLEMNAGRTSSASSTVRPEHYVEMGWYQQQQHRLALSH